MRSIPEFPDYFATAAGRVWSSKRGILLAEKINHNGYRAVSLYVAGRQVTRTVHQLIAVAYLGVKPAGAQVNHKDHNKSNNAPGNLEYVTPAENHLAWRTHNGLMGPNKSDRKAPRPDRTAAIEATARIGGTVLRFGSVADAVAAGFTDSGISLACRGKLKFHRGYSFKKVTNG